MFSVNAAKYLCAQGFVFAISGTASPTLFGCSGPRWYLVSPSRRYSKPSSGESTILNNSMSCGEIVPESAKAWKLITRFQYSRSEEHTSELQSPDHLVC